MSWIQIIKTVLLQTVWAKFLAMNLKKVVGDDKELLTCFVHELHELAQI